jgi:hypothetical protein
LTLVKDSHLDLDPLQKRIQIRELYNQMRLRLLNFAFQRPEVPVGRYLVSLSRRGGRRKLSRQQPCTTTGAEILHPEQAS